MKDNGCKINTVVRNVAALEAVRKVRHALIILLMVEFFVRYFYRYSVTVLVFIIWMVAGPFLVEQLMKKDTTREETALLPVLCKKYRYNYRELKAQMIVSIVCLLFLFVQLYANLHSSMEESYIIYAPVLYVFISLVGLAGLYMYSRKRIGNLLESNQL